MHTAKNSLASAKIILNLWSTKFTMVFFDVTSLFMKVHISGALINRDHEFHLYLYFGIQELLSLTRTCLSETSFPFPGNYYKQSDGLAMVSPCHRSS